MKYLSKDSFLAVVRDTPLVSIDLIVLNERSGQVLLGQRSNKPAQGFWFVPGGRIQKDESLDDAFIRLTKEELGLEISRKEAFLKGIYEHFYEDNFSAEPNISTHYVVLAYQVLISDINLSVPLVQHTKYKWVAPADIIIDETIHYNTRAYFIA